MGYNTQVLILNDGLGEIKKHPEEFVTNLLEAIAMGHNAIGPNSDDINVKCGNHVNLASVIPTQHADVIRVLVSHGNWMWNIPGKYGHSEHLMDRARTQKFIRDELIWLCREARRVTTETLHVLLDMEKGL